MINLNQKKAKYIYSIFNSLFITALLITNIIGGKFFNIKSIVLSCSIFAYPITFMITDILSEVFGKNKANALVKNGFIISIFITFLIIILNLLPTHDFSPIPDSAFKQIFGLTPGIIFGSMVAYLTAQFLDIRIFEFWRKIAPNHLWIRNNGSTMISQFIDTILCVTISLVIWPKVVKTAGIKPINFNIWITIIFSQYIFKAFIAVLDTPFVYLGVYFIKKKLIPKTKNTIKELENNLKDFRNEKISETEKVYNLFLGLFISVLILKNVTFPKYFKLNNVALSYETILSSLNFIFLNGILEVFDKRKARKTIIISIYIMIITMIIILISFFIPTYINSPISQKSFKEVFKYFLVFNIFYLPIYSLTYLFHIYLSNFIRKNTKKKYSWSLLSILICQSFETILKSFLLILVLKYIFVNSSMNYLNLKSWVLIIFWELFLKIIFTLVLYYIIYTILYNFVKKI